ncbi:hypothetical protein SDC9_151393 [bioreactor metagenome]|uniref:6-bladed beta-propeller n=1 Tax=bioreactor metagenome TaxID=1076179 RepID=A0A645EQP2_9ZZZZ
MIPYILDNGMSQIFVFNEAGNFIYKIDNKGPGSGEYTATSDIGIFNDNLFVLSSIDNKLYKFSTRNFKFLCSLRLQYKHL